MQLTTSRVAVALATVLAGAGGALATNGIHALALVPGPGTYTVNAAFDAPDATPGDGVCLSTLGPSDQEPACTLRAAIMEADADAAGSVITIAAGINPQLSIAPGSNDQATGDLVISTAMTVNGQGSGSTTVSIASSPLDRVFHVASGTSGTATIGKMTIQSGDPTADSSGSTSGGGIDEDDALQNGRPTLHLADVIIKNSKGTGGGGLHDVGGNLTADHITLSSNSATSGVGGGALVELTGGETVTLTNLQARSNSSTQGGGGSGGGLALRGTGTGSTVKVDGAVLDSNSTSNDGGGLYVSTSSTGNGGTFTFTHMTVTSNTANDGGGIYAEVGAGSATFSDSLIGDTSTGCDTGNDAQQSEGGGDGGGIWDGSFSRSVLYTRLLVGDNCADRTGGGVYFSGSSATLSNSTITGNDAGSNGGGLALGRSTNTSVTFATVTDNVSNGGSASGGGIYVGNGDVATLGGNVFDANVQFNAQQARGQFRSRQSGTPDLCQNDGTIADLGYNVVHGRRAQQLHLHRHRGHHRGPQAPAAGRQRWSHADPGAGAGSSALDTVPPGASTAFQPRATTTLTCTIATDQRGVTRPQGSACDSGAYELRVAAASPTPSPTRTASPTASAQPLIGAPNTGGRGASAGAPMVPPLALAACLLAGLTIAPLSRLRRTARRRRSD